MAEGQAPGEAGIRIVEEAGGEALHWTVVWDRALTSGAIDPFTQRDARSELMKALAEAAREGSRIVKVAAGTYKAAG